MFEFLKKSKMRRALVLGGLPVVAAAGLFFIPRAHAFGPWHGRHGHEMAKSPEEVREHMGRRVEFMLDRLDASDTQRDQVEAILDKRAPEFFALMTEGRTVRGNVKNALLADQVDRAAVDKARVELDALADRATDLGMDTLLQISEVLTPAQRKRIAEHLADLHP